MLLWKHRPVPPKTLPYSSLRRRSLQTRGRKSWSAVLSSRASSVIGLASALGIASWAFGLKCLAVAGWSPSVAVLIAQETTTAAFVSWFIVTTVPTLLLSLGAAVLFLPAYVDGLPKWASFSGCRWDSC